MGANGEGPEQRAYSMYVKSLKADCEVCRDQITQVGCNLRCQDRARRAKDYILAGIPPGYVDLDIEDYANCDVDTDDQKIERDDIYYAIKKYCSKIDEAMTKGWGMVLTGPFGTGKSLLANHVLKKAIDAGYTAKSREFSEMIHMAIRDEDFSGRQVNIYGELSNNDIYCMENVGWEYAKAESQYVPMKLDAFLSIRAKHGFPFIITTNETISELKVKYTDHIFSLIHEHCAMLVVPGADRRRRLNKRIKNFLSEDAKR